MWSSASVIPPGVISFPVIPPHESHGAGALKSEFTWRDHFPRGGITECTWRDYFLLIFIIGLVGRLISTDGTKPRKNYSLSSFSFSPSIPRVRQIHSCLAVFMSNHLFLQNLFPLLVSFINQAPSIFTQSSIFSQNSWTTQAIPTARVREGWFKKQVLFAKKYD